MKVWNSTSLFEVTAMKMLDGKHSKNFMINFINSEMTKLYEL